MARKAGVSDADRLVTTGGPGAPGAGGNGPKTIDPRVSDWTKDWKRLRMQKSRRRGGVEARILLALAFYGGEHYAAQVQDTLLTRAFRRDVDKNKLRLVFNMTRRQIDRKMGRLWSIAHAFTATPDVNTSLAFDKAEVIGDKLIPALDHKCRQSLLRWQIYKWCLLGGVAVEHVDWKRGVSREAMPKYDDASGELLWKDNLTGEEVPESVVNEKIAQGVTPERFEPMKEVVEADDVVSELYDPLRVFIDASVPTIADLGPGQALYLADVRTRKWVEDNFGPDLAGQINYRTDLSIIETKLDDKGTPVSGQNLRDLVPGVVGSVSQDDPDMCLVLTRYEAGCTEYPTGRRNYFVPNQIELRHEDESDELPFPEIPCVDYHWSCPDGATGFWTDGFVTDLIAPQKFLNKRISQLGEAANAQIYELLLLGPGLDATDIPSDFPGVVKDGVGENGAPLVQTVPRGQLPAFFVESIKMVVEFIEQLGSADLLSGRKFPTQMRGSLSVPMLQELLDSEDGPRFEHFGKQFALEKQMRVNRVKQFYPPIRILNYTGPNMRQEVLELHTDYLLRAGADFTITVDPSSLFPEISSMREARVRERLSGPMAILYTDPRTGRLDASRIAQDLRYGDKGREHRVAQYRKLARQILSRVRKTEIQAFQVQMPPQPMPPQQGQQQMDPNQGQPPAPAPFQQQPMPQQPPQWQLFIVRADESREPFVVYPFWAHSEMMDEYEAEMATTEFLDSSAPLKRTLLALYEQHRGILSKIQEAQAQAIENQMVQGAVAQATQQAAAKAASMAAESALLQVDAQMEAAGPNNATLEARIRELIGESQGSRGMGTQAPTNVQRGPSQLQ